MPTLLHLDLLCCCSTHMPFHHPRMPSYWWRSFRIVPLSSDDDKNVLIALTVLPGNHGHCCVSEAKQLPLKGHRHHFSSCWKVLKEHVHLRIFNSPFFPPSDCRLPNGTYWLIDLSCQLFHFVFLPGTVFLAIQLLGA